MLWKYLKTHLPHQLQSKLVCISWIIARSWAIHKSSWRKPDCEFVKKLLPIKWLNKELWIILSNTLLKMGSKRQDNNFLINYLLLFYEQELHFLFLAGNSCCFIVVSNTDIRDKATKSPQTCIIFIEVLSQSYTLFASNVFMKKLILTSVLYANCGSAVPCLLAYILTLRNN